VPGTRNLFCICVLFFLFFFFFFRTAPETHESSQAAGGESATTASLYHSHGNVGSKPRLRPTPQLRAMPDP